jgi:hypothetical protein
VATSSTRDVGRGSGVPRGRQQHHRRQREDATRASGEERAEPDPAGGLPLAQQQGGDQEAGHHEEDIDADEAARQAGNPEVPEHHERHRNRPQPLDVETSGSATHHG